MMKTILSILSLLLIPGFSHAQTPDFSLIGFAAMNGGTTGGLGGEIVTPATFDELNAYCTATQPYIILIDREFTGSNPDASNPGAPVRRVIKMASNKTLLGVGSSGFINQISIVINSQHNIILRNIKFTMKDVPVDLSGSEVKILGTNSDPDILSISADLSSIPEAERMTRNIWIDHCEFYNEDPAVMTDADRYDGLIDIKNDCQYITISWCYFHDHHKGCLSGSGNSDNYDRKTTMHHNYFDNISSRIPLQRYGKLHLLNNYIVNCENGLNVRIQSEAVAERNYFKDTKKPIFGKVSEGGTATELDNYFENCNRLSWVHIPSATSPDADALNESEEYNANEYAVPYAYGAFVTEVADVPEIVTTWAGVGKINSDPTALTPPPGGRLNSITFAPNAVTDELVISLQANSDFSSEITIADIKGNTVLRKKEWVHSGRNEFRFDLRPFSTGIYVCRVHTGKEVIVEKIFKIDN
ncbi:MAG: T9SS type A sorting domain-containing protein [Lewinella sp.]|nr:T9SS type A sorting domain-containing protein [Lewinella sp.]